MRQTVTLLESLNGFGNLPCPTQAQIVFSLTGSKPVRADLALTFRVVPAFLPVFIV